MDIGQVNAELDRLNASVTRRIGQEGAFKSNVYGKINTILNNLLTCASSVARPGASAVEVQDFRAQVQRLQAEIARLDNLAELNEAEAQYLVQPLSTEARAETLRWNTPVNKTSFTSNPVPYRASSNRNASSRSLDDMVGPGRGSSGGWTPKRKNPKRRPRTFRR